MILSKAIIRTGTTKEVIVAPIFLLPLIPRRFSIKGCKGWLGVGRGYLNVSTQLGDSDSILQ